MSSSLPTALRVLNWSADMDSSCFINRGVQEPNEETSKSISGSSIAVVVIVFFFFEWVPGCSLIRSRAPPPEFSLTQRAVFMTWETGRCFEPYCLFFMKTNVLYLLFTWKSTNNTLTWACPTNNHNTVKCVWNRRWPHVLIVFFIICCVYLICSSCANVSLILVAAFRGAVEGLSSRHYGWLRRTAYQCVCQHRSTLWRTHKNGLTSSNGRFPSTFFSCQLSPPLARCWEALLNNPSAIESCFQLY